MYVEKIERERNIQGIKESVHSEWICKMCAY